MKSLFLFSDLHKSNRIRLISLIFMWLIGSLSSLFLLKGASISLMNPLYFERISIVGMIVSLIVPIVIVYILLSLCNFYIILPVISLKAFFYTSCCYAISLSYGSAGWLVRALILFSDAVSIVLMLLLCYQYAVGKKSKGVYYFKSSIILLIFFGSLDYYVIAPFTMMLLKS